MNDKTKARIQRGLSKYFKEYDGTIEIDGEKFRVEAAGVIVDNETIWVNFPEDSPGTRPLEVQWTSPDITHFSKSKGPVSRNPEFVGKYRKAQIIPVVTVDDAFDGSEES